MSKFWTQSYKNTGEGQCIKPPYTITKWAGLSVCKVPHPYTIFLGRFKLKQHAIASLAVRCWRGTCGVSMWLEWTGFVVALYILQWLSLKLDDESYGTNTQRKWIQDYVYVILYSIRWEVSSSFRDNHCNSTAPITHAVAITIGKIAPRYTNGWGTVYEEK